MLEVSLFIRSESFYVFGLTKQWSGKSWLRFSRKCGHSSIWWYSSTRTL